MSAMVWITMGTVGVVSPLVYLRMRRKRSVTPVQPPATDANEYAAVSIHPGLIACDAVKQLAEQRILENDAPALPVPGCDEQRCQCRYRYHADRRSGEDQRNAFGAATALVSHAADQRKNQDRRAVRKKVARPVAYYNDYS